MRLDHITLYVASLDRSIPYNQHLLSMLGVCKLRHFVWTDDGGFYFQFMQARPGTSDYERFGPGMNHLGFGASSVKQVRDIQSSMQQAGFDTPTVQNLGGATALFMKDPDGIRFEVTHYPAGMSVVD